jgi:hypothetical protein
MIVYGGANASSNLSSSASATSASSNPYASSGSNPASASVDDGFVVDLEFEHFLKNNFYYDAHQALQLCSDAQLMHYYFAVCMSLNLLLSLDYFSNILGGNCEKYD